MAKRSTIALFPAYSTIDPFTDFLMVSATGSKVACLDLSTLYTIVMQGEKLKVSQGMVTSGTIETMRVANADGDPVYTISGLSINAGIIQAENMLEFQTSVAQLAVIGNNNVIGTNGADDLVGTASLGRDVVSGRGGDDSLSGGAGSDVLIGGAGEDEFVFASNMDTDKIRDFDANNGDGAQDLIDGIFANATISASADGKNTIVDFGAGDRFILLGVTSGQIDANDFTA
ncbi:calcium-binding protein [Rhizobium sp. LjRoot254]|uniref:calcium-binding protein n=1 Tax=Rhizobium sp. LjRoot254 TaxID=3342297 RepID=UPI003ED0AC46